MMELALLLPMLLLTTIGLVDFGRAAFEAIEVENAAHAGAAYGSRSKAYASDAVGIKTAAFDDLGDKVDKSKFSVESERYCECPDGSAISCDVDCEGVLPLMYVRVRVEKPFSTLLTYPGVANKIELEREVHLRVR